MIKKNQLLTRDAVKYKDLIEESLQYAEIDPAKMKFSISKNTLSHIPSTGPFIFPIRKSSILTAL
jgi:hypothetical protein